MEYANVSTRGAHIIQLAKEAALDPGQDPDVVELRKSAGRRAYERDCEAEDEHKAFLYRRQRPWAANKSTAEIIDTIDEYSKGEYR